MGVWNGSFVPLGYLAPLRDYQTLTSALIRYSKQFQTLYHIMAAGAVIALVPVIMVFIFLQRYFVRGLTRSNQGVASAKRPEHTFADGLDLADTHWPAIGRLQTGAWTELSLVVNDSSPYHLSRHGTRELLDPIRAELEKLERRTRHYRERVPLGSEEDSETLRVASEALATARGAIEEASGLAVPVESAGNGTKTASKRVLITGAGGRIGHDLAERLRDRYALRLMYHHQLPETPPVADWVQTDTSQIEPIVTALEGIEAVVHMAADPHTRAPWESVLQNNIIATYNVFEAARLAGVNRIVFASTNHVMGMYDRDRQWPIYADQPVRPDSLYGVSKAFGENLGRFWYDQYGISVICLRIGWMLPEPKDDISRWMWLSPRDCAQIVSCALETDLGFDIFYAISANSRRHWDITDSMEQLGYRPEDDAERSFGRS